ncbi:MAG TPA: sugar ABC transporter ATP-binding protein [Marisediminicola sp.]|jgi:ribose transport system ATP-binding protein|nr:sugar ABC transporter ATP-binding protein [Marisediminicola sp.]
MTAIGKSFGGVQVLRDVNLDVLPGEVVALVGENGAGKSTLIKILTGLYTATSGVIEVDGRPVSIRRPADAEKLGIRVIHQERHLAGRLTIAEHFFLGRSDRSFFTWRSQVTRAERELRELVGLELPGTTLVDDLSVAEQQLLQLAIATASKPRLLVLDEPTAPLAAREVARLFATIRSLQAQGVAVIYISHYLQEVQQIASRVVVLRNGERVGALTVGEDGTDAAAELSSVVELMIGRSVQEFSGRAPRQVGSDVAPLLEIEGLNVPGRIEDITIAVRPGEIVGVIGLVGSGTEELADAITGLLPHGGSVSVGGRAITSPRGFVAAGGAHVPANRHRDGILGRQSVRENLSLASLGRVTGIGGLIRGGREQKLAATLIERLDIRPSTDTAIAGTLSGGNQQKVVLGRWLAASSRLLVLDQPTSGVDIGSREGIYAEINRLVDAGAGVLLVTLDLEELVGLSDRIFVLYRGRIAAEQQRGEATEDGILALTTGATSGVPQKVQR